MPDNPQKKGADRKRRSQQKHEVAYRRAAKRRNSAGKQRKG
jgi:hypothetical protein